MGGNDGLNTVVPYADSKYPQLRSRIGIPAGSVLQLDSKLGLNPVMSSMMSLWNANRLALIENVGYPNSSLSHFSSRDIWHTADPDAAQRRGWLGRWADEYPRRSQPLEVHGDLPDASEDPVRRQRSGAAVREPLTYAYQTDGSTPATVNQMDAFLVESSAQYETP
jgi:hypothetical protein